MPRDYTLGLTVVYKVRDEASKNLDQVKKKADQTGQSFQANAQSLRSVARSATIMGVTLLALSQYLEKSNNQTAKGIGNMLGFAGAILTSIGTVSHFISAVIQLSRALRGLAVSQAILRAFTGPVGWGILAGSVVAAGAATAAIGGIPSFAGGGIVPGPAGRPMAAIVHGGERISPIGSSAGVTVVIQGGTFMGSELEARQLARRVGEILNEEQRTRRSGPRFGSL